MVRLRELGRESNRGISSRSEKAGFMGEGGAYISESCESSAGAVRAEKSLRILSHWVCVVCREEWRATRREEDGDDGDEGP
jgi:hypothetical protein